MRDRIPTKPGRVQLVPSPDDDDLFILTRADEPTQAGTPLNKASLLSDATAALFELTDADAATVDAALSLVAGQYTRVRVGTAAPGAATDAKRGDVYIMDAGGDRHIYLCDAVGEREVDLGATWERGTMDSRGVSGAADYRVRTDMIRVSAGTKLTIASGYRYFLRLFDDNREYASSVSFRNTAYTFAADTYVRIVIQKYPEDTSITADVDEFSSALTATMAGAHWTPLAGAREVRKTAVFTSSGYFTVPADLRGTVTVQCFGGGSSGSPDSSGFGGGGGHMATWTGVLTQKRYEVTVGGGGYVGRGGEPSSFGDLCTAAGGGYSLSVCGPDGGSGGGGGNSATYNEAGNGAYGGGGGGYNTAGGNGGTYGGGGGGGSGGSGGTGKSGAFAGGSGSGSYGGGGAGWTAAGKYATSSTGGAGGAGQNTTGFGLDFEGTGAAGTVSGGGGGYGGSGGNGVKTGSLSTGGGGGGYGANGGGAGSASGGGGGGYGGPGGAGSGNSGGGGGGYGLSGRGGSLNDYSRGGVGGIAAGGCAGHGGGGGCVVIYYTGIEVV